METEEVVCEREQPLPSQPVRDRKTPRRTRLGALRLPIAGPHRPLARLSVSREGEIRWRVRLWENDRVVVRFLDTEVLRTFARVNGLHEVAEEVERILADARRRGGR